VTLRIMHTVGDDELARVFVAETDDGSRIELVESIQPPHPREEKWVLIVSTLKGCPIGCPICDAGGSFRGKLTSDEILEQVDFLVRRRYPDGRVPVSKLKVQLARMGDPALNDAVLDALARLPSVLQAPGLMPCISTVAPAGRERFFGELASIKDRLYAGGRFQMQLSIHTTDDASRRRLVPARTLSLAEMAALGERFFAPGDRKVTLNFAPAVGLPLDPDALAPLFDPEVFAIKLTPINPTRAALASGLRGVVDPRDGDGCREVVRAFEARGYEVILSIGDLRENAIGSNCGMYVRMGEECEA
jgi:23S rRNA (adenine2503-C2)-methyltransferase